MSDEPLPQLRPVRLQGKAYFDELRRILHEEGPAMLDTLARWRAKRGGITPVMIGALAVKYTLNFKATCEFLEDSRILRCGTYDRIKDGGIRPTEALRAGREWLKQNGEWPKTTMEVAFERAALATPEGE